MADIGVSGRAVAQSRGEPVITGFGVVSSVGVDAESFWDAVLAGVSGARTVDAFDARAWRTTLACEVRGGGLDRALSDRGRPRASVLAVRAASEALATAGLEAAAIDALCVGTTMGGLPDIEGALEAGAPAGLLRQALDDGFADGIADALGVPGAAETIATSCSAGNLAIFRAVEWIRAGRAARVLAGGADAFSRLAFVGFARMRAMSTTMCRPFDRHRTGMLLGEGAGFLVVEARDSAARRGARVYAVPAGFGMTCDAHHLSTPSPSGEGAARAMAIALDDAGLDRRDIDAVSAHGTGTPRNDAAEASACATVFGPHRPYVSSLKALIGHTLGAASAIQAVACTLSLRDQQVVPAWNVEDPDPECDVNLPMPGRAGRGPVRAIVSNGLAFGGNNSCLVLRAPN